VTELGVRAAGEPEEVRADAAGVRPRRAYDVGVLHKALDVLELLALGEALTAVELARRAGISKAAAYRILGTLERRGYVRRDERDRRFAVGTDLLALARGILSSADLVVAARRALRDLRDEFGETVNLGAASRDRLVYLEVLESERGLRTTVDVGSFDHLHATALGRAILSALPREEARTLLAGIERVPVTERTRVGLDDLMAELEQARARGYSLDDEENELGARCVGVPVRDEQGRPIAALSISGPTHRMRLELLPRMAERLAAAATEIERALGVRTP
jgi:IclR family acetate operon transcriptional repressor